MSRSIIPWTFFFGALLSLVLLITDTVRASRPAVKWPDVRGHWDGFFLEADDTAALGLVRSDITQQLNRRIAGNGQLVDPITGAQLAVYNFNGTLGIDNFITGTGRTLTGRVNLQSDLQLFAGKHGNAGVMDTQFLFVPRRGAPTHFGAVLLHPFPDKDAPDFSGEGLGVFRSQLDSTFEGGLELQILPRERNGFPGHVSFTSHSSLHPSFSWQSRATINDQGHLIMIAQGKTGRMLVDGAFFPRQGGASSAAVDGLYTLILNNGRRDLGFYNFNLTPRLP
jgi:hypothetical protein